MVFNLTPFYPEGGGQVGDKGYLEEKNGTVHYITDTKKENNLIVHFSKTIPDNFKDIHKAVVDRKQRNRSSSNHTATHLMHQALRTILGDHVEQKGSMVHSGMFRFDFSHFSKLTDDQVRQLEDFVNSRIKEQLPLDERRNVPFETAVSSGAIALFGEKYGDTVRTVSFGKSTELCGGCHVKNTSEIWYFKIISESAVASGIRRIEAITGDAVISYFEEQSQVLNELKVVMKQQNDPVQGYKSLIEENNSLKKEILVLSKIKIKAIKSNIKKNIVLKNKINFAAHEVDLDAKNLKDLAFEMGDELENLFLVLASKKNNKPLLACFISKNLIKSHNYNASNVVKDLGQYILGSGGGQEFYATAGGKDINGIEKALKMAISHLK